MRPSAGVTAAFAVLIVARPVSLLAQDVRLSVPLEYDSGFAGGSSPKTFAGGIHAGLLARLGGEGTRLVGPAGALLYDGASWTAAGGVRVGLRVPGVGARDAGLYLFAEGLKGRGRAPVSVSLIADLPARPALFARFGVSWKRDLERDHNEIALVVGFDLARWAGEVFGDDGPRGVQP